ncbi:hypothetical protein N0V82_005083 [Gnomoniopsis sp. IMI 355080]|nr:hypothetical protein N0V82_005083 [Gnomoniopsis sp. IMI 355080]
MAVAKEKRNVCVIGAGLSGLVTLKECLSEGFEAHCFEARPEIGGQWAQQPDVTPSDTHETAQSSIYDGVVLNSCRDTSALPDFPLDPARYGDYFGHRLHLRYLREYAEHFGLMDHIHLSTRVVACEPRGDGSWAVKTQQDKGEEGQQSEAEENVYDAVFVCVGHLSKPSIPEVQGRDEYKGQFLHSHYYRRPGPFDRKKVAIIGFGSSAVDIACELAAGADEVHVISRRGGWVLPRYVLGKPTEAWDNRATQVWVPVSTAQWLQTKLLQVVEGKPPQVMQPKHKLLEQSPTIRGDFTEKVRTGKIIIHRGSIERFAEDGLVLSSTIDDAEKQSSLQKNKKGEEEEEKNHLQADVVISCTGYDQFDQAFLPSDVTRGPDTPAHRVDLYKLMVSPRHANLFLMGHAETVGALAPVVDAQARWACAVLQGRIQLPSPDKMLAETRAFHAWQAKHFLTTERHALAVYVVSYVDELLAPLGAKPSFGKCVGRVFSSGHPWRSLKVLNAVWFGIPSSAQWRLFGYGAKEKLATETLLRIAGGKEKFSDGEVKLLAEK